VLLFRRSSYEFQRIYDYFKNSKCRHKMRSRLSADTEELKSIVSFEDVQVMTGRKIYKRTHKEDILRLAEEGMSNEAANYQTALKQLWDGLTDEAWADWCKKVESENNPPGVDHLFQYVHLMIELQI
jgi:hypothetical protein